MEKPGKFFLMLFVMSLFISIPVDQTICHAQNCKPDSIKATTPDERFIINSNDTVTDRRTGLMWKKCPEGATGSACSQGSASVFQWDEALKMAKELNGSGGFAGYTDWRLPNLNELKSILERQCSSPSINLNVFPDTPPGSFWSSSPHAGFVNYAWGVSFDSGGNGFDYEDYYHYVRLVRDDHFIDNGNGTVTDRKTGLMWKQCPEGLSGNACNQGSTATFQWDEALKRAKTVNETGGFAGYTDWRMPSLDELKSIMESQYSPAINVNFFPNMPSVSFWSSSPHAGFFNYTSGVGFDSGGNGFDYEDYYHCIRLVRNTR